MAINIDTLKSLVSSKKEEINAIIKRQEYYNGIQDILTSPHKRRDGQPNQKNVNNWIKYVSDEHVAYALSNNVIYASEEPNPPLEAFNKAYDEFNLNISDNENYLNCLNGGYAIEVVTLLDGVPFIQNYNPQEWILIEDVNGNLIYAIHVALIPENSVVDGQIVKKAFKILTVYDDVNITVFHQTETINQKEQVDHNMGTIPVVVYEIQKNRKPAITNSLINQQDIYNIMMNAGQDDFLYSIDTILALSGWNPHALTEIKKDKFGNVTGPSMLEQMKEYGVINLDENGKAEFLTRGNYNDKLEYLIKENRKQIHIEGKVVDVEEIVGGTGAASAVSLKLKYAPVNNVAKQYTTYFERGLRKRIDLINILLEIISKPIIENYDVVFTYNIPINDQEIIQNIDKMTNVMDEETILSQLSFIKNPQKVIEKKKNETKIEDNVINNDKKEPTELEIILKTE